MGQETTTTQQQQQQSGATQDEITTADEGMDEIEIPPKTMMDKMNVIFEKFARTGMGQMVLERSDRVLKVLEDTAKWSLPQDDSEAKLERPLPWMFFIPLIAWLRIARFWLSFGTVMMGGSPVTPEAMVYNIQIKRRRLRAIRVPGLRATRRVEAESGAMSSGSGKKTTLMGKLSSMFDSAVCRPGLHREMPTRRVFGDKTKSTDDNTGERSSAKRPRDDDNADLNLTVDQMLNKYANEDSDDDSDYVPNADEDDDSSQSSSDSMSSTEETEKENAEKPSEDPKDGSKSDQTTLDQSVTEIKENGGPKHRPMPKPIADIKLEPISDADSGSEQAKTPREQPKGSANGEGHKASTEVAVQQQKPKETYHTPPLKQQQQQLSVVQDAEAKQKATPGHETAASLKPSIGAKASVAPPLASGPRVTSTPPPREEFYRTITTQTSIEELDWSITVKTEISHTKKHRPATEVKKPEESSVHLTPASSAEDIFYSPIGSPQDFHAIFHPVPLVKVSPVNVTHSTPKEIENPATETTETNTNPNQKKPQNQKQHQPHHHQQHYNNKNRNKNRR